MATVPHFHSITPLALTDDDWQLLDSVKDEPFTTLFYLGIDQDNWELAVVELCKRLALLTGNNARRIDAFFRQCALFSPRWDTIRRNGLTWGRHLTSQAIRENCLQLGLPSPVVVEGVMREGQLVVLSGDYHVGKTPLVRDLAFHVQNGLPWLGRETYQRDVVVLDFETPHTDFVVSLSRLQERYGGTGEVPLAYLLSAKAEDGRVRRLPYVSFKWDDRLRFIRDCLDRSYDALLIIDPAEHFFRFNRDRSTEIHNLYIRVREVLTEFPKSAIVMVGNHRRRGHRKGRPSLLKDPQGWLEGSAGNLDILNRCDVRLGLDFHDDPDLRVIHGVRRSESASPIIIRTVGAGEFLAGFEVVPSESVSMLLRLGKSQRRYWELLPTEFHFEEIVTAGIVPRSSLSRLLREVRAMGLLESSEGVHRKV